VDRLDFPESVVAKTRVMEEYDWDKYKVLGIGDKKLNESKMLFELSQDIIKDEGLALTSIFRKLYIPFQYSNMNVFWIDLRYTSYEKGGAFLVFKMNEEPDRREYGIADNVKTKWFSKYKEWGLYYNETIKKETVVKLIKKSYEYIVGA
jgi:hypothetical protein